MLDRSLPYQRRQSQEPRPRSVAQAPALPQSQQDQRSSRSEAVYFDATSAALFALHRAQEDLALPARTVARTSYWFSQQAKRSRRANVTRYKLAQLKKRVRWLRRRAIQIYQVLNVLQSEPEPRNVMLLLDEVAGRAAEALIKLALFEEMRGTPESDDWWFYHMCSAEALKRLVVATSNARATLRAYDARMRQLCQPKEGRAQA
ncbi:hypothetical protein [Ktedonobacter racemifer]|uniref:Uncharacterized protein n=1 Tax=Ktedonobacter racemifer DSM 44963 TaxID=485913 RepID=D6U8S7_KTERA|nr:hypothetical protein [Ktedonobacter racemifer]EFH79637.1 hypothetical protein Krac_0115 [Ktedonobacter racemifer DSM 44963]